MNAGIVLSFHGSINGIIEKAGGNAKKVSELMLIRKYAERFDRVFVFSHDSESCEHHMPENCSHIKLRNRFIYIAFGWIVLLYFTWRQKLGIIRLVGAAALPTLFITGWVVKSRIIIKYYYLWYNTAGNNLKRWLIKRAERFLIRPLDDVIAANSDVQDFIGDPKKIMDVNEGIITEEFDPDKIIGDELMTRIGGVKLIFVGRLVDIKDPVTLLEAYELAREEIFDLRLVICGDGPLRPELEKMADKGVHFLGFVGNIPSLLKGADIFVITSLYDASPRSLMEAMCMGLPTVATKVGGVPEYLTNNSGYLTPPKDAEVLAEKIVKLARDKELRVEMGKNARRRVLEKYDLAKNLEKELGIILKGA